MIFFLLLGKSIHTLVAQKLDFHTWEESWLFHFGLQNNFCGLQSAVGHGGNTFLQQEGHAPFQVSPSQASRCQGPPCQGSSCQAPPCQGLHGTQWLRG